MLEWIKEHPEAVYLVSAALVGWVIRSLRQLVKTEALKSVAAVLDGVEKNRQQDKLAFDMALSQIRSQLAELGQRFDMHLERCQLIQITPATKPTLNG